MLKLKHLNSHELNNTNYTDKWLYMNLFKKDFIIEKQLPRRIMKYTRCFSYPSYATRVIFPYINSRVSAKNDKVDGLSVK